MNPKTLVLEPEPEAYSRTVTQVRRVSYDEEDQVVNDAPLFHACLSQQECRKAVTGAALLKQVSVQPVRSTFFYQLGMILRQIHLQLTDAPEDAYELFATEFVQLLWQYSTVLVQSGIDVEEIYSRFNTTVFPLGLFSPVRLLGGVTEQTFFLEEGRVTGFRDEGIVRFGSCLQDCLGLIQSFHAEKNDIDSFNDGYLDDYQIEKNHLALWGAYVMLKQQKNGTVLSQDVLQQLRQYSDIVLNG